jgi:hypothetical protein
MFAPRSHMPAVVVVVLVVVVHVRVVLWNVVLEV